MNAFVVILNILRTILISDFPAFDLQIEFPHLSQSILILINFHSRPINVEKSVNSGLYPQTAKISAFWYRYHFADSQVGNRFL